jgi:biofilm PGA synthesis N-glycosyltransferase PgaC
VKDWLVSLGDSPLYTVAMWFLAAFPVVIAALAINSSRQFYLDRMRQQTEGDNPHHDEMLRAQAKWPLVSVVIPARNEEETLGTTIECALRLQWPEVEVIVINDGSTDLTSEVLAGYANDPRVCVITHETPLGKSQSLNDGLEVARSEIVLILDADSVPARNVLNRMVSHMVMADDIAAVTGNPRAVDVPTLLTKLQAIEFSSTISTLRRGQSAWGRINTVSGIMTVLRRNVVLQLGGFALNQPTEDIELTWRLHRAGFRCIYEPAAQVGMHVPQTLRLWFRQRTRWGRGLVRVLQRHTWGVIRKNEWPAYPVLLEAWLAIIWCHVLIVMTIIWVIAIFYGVAFLGNSLIIGRWGAMTVGIAILQILWGMRLDSHHDKSITKLWPLAPVYPLVYWWLSALVVVVTTLPTLLTRPKTVLWASPRVINR